MRILAIIICSISATALLSSSSNNMPKELTWLGFEEGIKLAKDKNKFILVDVYTEWCGWCKRMDITTYKDPKVLETLNNHFVSIKFDAESKEPIVIGDATLNFVEKGRKGYHALAHSLMNGNMSYPTSVFLTPKLERIIIAPGYMDGKEFKIVLDFIHTKSWEKMSYDDFKTSYNK